MEGGSLHKVREYVLRGNPDLMDLKEVLETIPKDLFSMTEGWIISGDKRKLVGHVGGG